MRGAALCSGLAAAIGGILLAAGAASPQAIDWLAETADVEFIRESGSARLDAMGGLRLAIPDEGAELNLSDYGSNLSGVLWDSDGRRWETWGRSSTRVDDFHDAQGRRNRVRREIFEVGGEITWRGAGNRLLGLDYVLNQFDTTQERGDDSKIRGPLWGGFVGQRIGRFVLSGAFRVQSDNQDLVSDNVFAIRHEGGGQRYSGSLAYRGEAFDVGLDAERQVNAIDGISRDEARFHTDRLLWRRPVAVYTGSAVWRISESVRGGAKLRAVRVDGRQEVTVSWSDRMPQNPSRENYRDRGGTFDEEVRGLEAASRWEMRPFETLTIGAEGEIGRVETSIYEGYNYKGSRREQDTRTRSFRAGAGAGYEMFEGRLRIGIEGHLQREDLEERFVEGIEETASRTADLRVGLEWFATDRIAIRGGYMRTSWDADLDAPRTLGFGNTGTFGLGFVPAGGLVQLDAAVRYHDFQPDYEGSPRFERSVFGVSFGARFLL